MNDNFDGIDLIIPEESGAGAKNNEKGSDGDLDIVCKKIDGLSEKLFDLEKRVESMNDLFTRRLFEDKQKKDLIENLKSQAGFAFIEPFLYDLIQVLDRLEQVNTDTARSFYDEILEILEHRGVKRIDVTPEFNRNENRIVEVEEDPEIDHVRIVGIRRRGYKFNDKVIRPAEVIVHKPIENKE